MEILSLSKIILKALASATLKQQNKALSSHKKMPRKFPTFYNSVLELYQTYTPAISPNDGSPSAEPAEDVSSEEPASSSA